MKPHQGLPQILGEAISVPAPLTPTECYWPRADVGSSGGSGLPRRDLNCPPPLGWISSFRQLACQNTLKLSGWVQYKHSCSYRIIITPSMYITPFSPRAADFCIISLILPCLGGGEDPQFTDAGERRGKKEGERGGGTKEGAGPGSHTRSYRG